MSRVAVIGEGVRVQGYSLAGALVLPADSRQEAIAAWRSLPGDVAVVVLTPDAAAWLGRSQPGQPGARHPGPLTVVMPS